ncbi:putative oxidoreductase/MT0587 [bacterium BMS3Bbin03]|nr:putative oxidoreductase/MT0587 [bacterium BMS3Bbin03]
MEIFDVIIVGLGPAGSSTAYQLASRGHRVLALEKEKMPRYKPCGGCLSRKIENILDDDFKPLVEETIYNVILTFQGEGEIRVESKEPIAYMVMRDRFDHFLAQKAAAAGAEVHDNEPVTGIEMRYGEVVVHTKKGTYRAQYLVGADGVNGVVGRALGYGPKRNIAVALEGEANVSPEDLRQLRGTMRLDMGCIPYGYGWVFPKQDHWSLGVGSVKNLARHPGSYYSVFLEEQGLEGKIQQEKRRGYRIPLFAGRGSQITKGRSLLVGDAAALVDPFLGEGIYYAVRSGQLAAGTLHSAMTLDYSDLSGYGKKVAREMFPEFEAAQKVARFAYHFLRMGFTLIKAVPAARESSLEMLRGRLSYVDYWQGLKKNARFGLYEFFSLLKTRHRKAEATYDRVAAQYDTGLFLWKQFLGGAPFEHVKRLIQAHIRDGAVVLDAGTGTGETVKSALRLANPGRVIGIDISGGMLQVAREKIRDRRVQFEKADMTRLPYPDKTFDVVLSTWAIETLPNPKQAVGEFLRVIKDDGYVMYAFSSLPPFGIGRLRSFFLEGFFQKTFDWHFLSIKERPYHDCGQSSLATFGNGLATVVVLRKCCTVDSERAPCRLPEPRLGSAAIFQTIRSH